jgi:oligopeptide/dipeptide ABC transporter ATP-binding protein
MAMEPELIIADEPTTAIDAGLQVQLVNKLKEIVGKGKRSMIFISHDLGVLRNVSDRIAIIYAGNIVEQGAAQEIMTRPCHPYSRDLIAALPRLVKDKRMPSAIPGTLPQPDNKPQGCVYSDRCALAQSKCRTHRPELKEICSNRQVRCFFPVNLES